MKYLADNFDVAELASDKCLGEVVEHGGEVRLIFYHLREVFHSQWNHLPRSQLFRSGRCPSSEERKIGYYAIGMGYTFDTGVTTTQPFDLLQ